MIPMRGAGRDSQLAAESKEPEFEFRRCPSCGGYGVLDSGNNCRLCGGRGKGGLRGTGVIGSGEIIIEKATGRTVSPDEFARMMIARGPMKL